jgi:hypothetical protein
MPQHSNLNMAFQDSNTQRWLPWAPPAYNSANLPHDENGQQITVRESDSISDTDSSSQYSCDTTPDCDFELPRTDEEIRAVICDAIRESVVEYPVPTVKYPIPADDDDASVVRRFLYHLLIGCSYISDSEIYPIAIRCTVQDWYGTGAYFKQLYYTEDGLGLAELCPRSGRDCAGISVQFPLSIRSSIATRVVLATKQLLKEQRSTGANGDEERLPEESIPLSRASNTAHFPSGYYVSDMCETSGKAEDDGEEKEEVPKKSLQRIKSDLKVIRYEDCEQDWGAPTTKWTYSQTKEPLKICGHAYRSVSPIASPPASSLSMFGFPSPARIQSCTAPITKDLGRVDSFGHGRHADVKKDNPTRHFPELSEPRTSAASEPEQQGPTSDATSDIDDSALVRPATALAMRVSTLSVDEAKELNHHPRAPQSMKARVMSKIGWTFRKKVRRTTSWDWLDARAVNF